MRDIEPSNPLSSFIDTGDCYEPEVFKKSSKKKPVKIGLGDAKQSEKEAARFIKYKEKESGHINTLMSVLFNLLPISPTGYVLSMIPPMLKVDKSALRKTYQYCVGANIKTNSHDDDILTDNYQWVPFMISKLDPNDSKNPYLLLAIQERISKMSRGEIPTPLMLTNQAGEEA
jgi:hypothetical protein